MYKKKNLGMECFGKLILTKMQMRMKFLGKDILVFSENFYRQTLSDYHKKSKAYSMLIKLLGRKLRAQSKDQYKIEQSFYSQCMKEDV